MAVPGKELPGRRLVGHLADEPSPHQRSRQGHGVMALSAGDLR
jgi:hypothetical protein